MQNFMIALLICSITMSALLFFYMAVTPLLAKHYSVTVFYYTWLIFIIGLIIPFRPKFKNSPFKVTIPNNITVPVPKIGNGIPSYHPVPNAPSPFSWWQIAAAVWLIGMILFLAYHIIRHYRFLKLTTRWSENITDEQTLTLVQNLKTQMGLSKNIDLQICDSIGSPMMIGFTSPRILLPRINFTKKELYFILKHELVHYKRKDLWYKCLVLIATAVHWFNPVVHLMAKAINLQCELSCDAQVIHNTDTDTRQYYIKTIINVVKHYSKQKTALSTNFYGGKKGMKKRIFSIMDSNKKKMGIVVLCCALTLTLTTGVPFAAKAKTQKSPEWIGEEDAAVPFSYSFYPNPEIYSQYLSYGITISDDDSMLLYNGQRVRLFVDERSDMEAFFLDEAGEIDLNVIRNADGNIINIESISKQKAQAYRSAFFAGDTPQNLKVQETVKETEQDTVGENKLKQYSAYGITLSADGRILYHNGQRVKLLVDKLSDDNFETFWFDEDGTVNLLVNRNSTGEITNLENISEEQAQKYHSSLEELNEKVDEKIRTLFPESV